jgi:predicted AlkP superfamily pyrophosphatase or phosphodiesterase
MRKQQPQLTLAYLPHLDYDFQRFPDHDPQRVAEVDACAGRIIDAASETNTQVVIVSEYGLSPVSRPVHLNRHLRGAGLLSVRVGPFGESMMPGESAAFAVADHQLAHIYVRDRSRMTEVRSLLQSVDGIDRVVEPAEIELDHPRSGELIALAKSDSWFTYYYWDDDRHAPDFARTVDIHRKPGYDPCELFLTSKARAIARVAQKKIGFRYKMDVIPLNANLVGGSHGIYPSDPNNGPLVIGPADANVLPPDDMRGLAGYVDHLLSGSSPQI